MAVLSSPLRRARETARIAGHPLGGMPGVRSARWAGPGASDADNLELLLRQVSDVADDRRTARFVCAMALVVRPC